MAEPPMSYNEPPIQSQTDLAELYHAAKGFGEHDTHFALTDCPCRKSVLFRPEITNTSGGDSLLTQVLASEPQVAG